MPVNLTTPKGGVSLSLQLSILITGLKSLCIEAKVKYLLLFLILFLPVAMAAPAVNLTSPQNASLSNQSVVAFYCNASSENNISAVSFYNDISGNFSLNWTKRLTGIEKDSSTTLLCHFDNTYACDGGTGINDSTSFEQGKSLQGVAVSSPGTLKYNTSGILSANGSSEFWIKVGFDPASANVYWLFDTGTVASNIDMYSSSNILYFRFMLRLSDDSVYETISLSGISSWNMGEWHFISAMWYSSQQDNELGTNVFIDGSNISSSSNYFPGELATEYFGQYLFLGSDANGEYHSNSVFDELRMSNRHRSEAEISSAWAEGSADHRNVSANFSLANVPDGIYKWNCLAQDNESQSWGGNNFSLFQDVSSPPRVNWIQFSPNSPDDIDPGVTLNVTANITSISNISNVTFQYKYDVDWVNLTMSNTSSDTWNASFTTINTTDPERIYYYRIFANDTQSHYNTSQSASFNSTWDYTWTANISNTTAQGYFNNESYVGVLSINNTGDGTLAITLLNNWPRLYSYNTTNPFDVPAKMSRDVNITAQFASYDSSGIMAINISAQPTNPSKTASPLSAVTSIIMNTYTGGPFIDIIIDSMPSQVSHSQAGVNMSVTIRNIGNETAHNVMLNWSFPPGWLNTSGGLSQDFGDMSPLVSNTSNITMIVGSSAASGVASVCINVSRDENGNHTKCQDILVNCVSGDGACGNGCNYANDAECSAPQSGSSPSSVPAYVGFQAPQQKYAFSLSNKPRVDGYRNRTIYFDVLVRNTENKTIMNSVELLISGYPPSQIKITPIILKNISFGYDKSFHIELAIPQYMKYGPYNLSLQAAGKAKRLNYEENETTVRAISTITVFVHSVDENQTTSLVSAAKYGIEKMKTLGMDVKNVENLANQTRASMADFDYDTAKELAEKIIEIQEQAFAADSLIKEVSQKLDKAAIYKISTNETEKLHELALSAFARGDYKRAEERASGAFLAYGLEVGNQIVVAEAIEKNWKIAAVIFAVAVASIILIYRHVAVRKRIKKLISLKNEEMIITSLLKSLQSRFFQSRTIGKSEFEDEGKMYEKRLAMIKKEQASLEPVRKGFFGFSVFSNERKRASIISMIEEAQRNYYERRAISKKIYRNTMNELRKELAETEKKPQNGSRKIWLSLMLVFFLISLTAPAYAASNLAMNQTSAADEQHAKDAIIVAESLIKEAQASGFGIKRMNDTLTDAKLMMYQGRYLNAVSLALYVKTIKDAAVSANQLIDVVEGKMQDSEKRGVNTTPADELFKRGLEAFISEIYEDAEDYFQKSINALDEAENALLIKKTVEASEKDNIILALRQNWEGIAAILGVAAISLLMVYKLTEIERRNKKIAKLREEKANIEYQVKNIQKRYFLLREMPKSEYVLVLKKHRERLGQVNKNIIMLSSSHGTGKK